MKKFTLIVSCAAVAQFVGQGTVALAQETSGGEKAEKPAEKAVVASSQTGGKSAVDDKAKADELAEVIVTGSIQKERRFDVSYAVNSLSQDDIKKLAPLNYADLLGQLPGIQVEATGGEEQNITRVRGIPSDDGQLVFQQDGLVLFHELNGFFFRGDSMVRNDLMTERVEVVRGGPAPIYVSQAAAVANNISRTGSDVSQGEFQTTYGTTGLYRLDAFQSGPLGGNNYYAVGGFIRRDDGARDNGFPTDQGGEIRANFKHVLDNGSVLVSGTYHDDHNVFYLPIPVADPRNPNVSLNPYIDYFTGTLNSSAFRDVNIKYDDGAGVLQSLHRDLANGRHLQFGNVGLQYEQDVDGWQVSVKTGLTKGQVDFDALYSTTNPVDANSFAAGYLAAAQAAFGTSANPVTRLGYAMAGTNGTQVYDPYTASGLVMSAQYRAVGSQFYSGQADISASRKFETSFGTHDIKTGFYGSAYGETLNLIFQDYLMQVHSQPRTLDLVAYAGNGSVLGYVTDKGVLRYATTLVNGDTDATVFAAYADDTWEIMPDLRLDGGVRYERDAFNGYSLLTGTKNLGDPTTLADDATSAYTGATQGSTIHTNVFDWTVGLNYDFNRHFGTYVRASVADIPPSATVATQVNPSIVKSKTDQYEVGFKSSFGASYLYLTGFYLKFNPLDASFAAFNPQTGRNDQTLSFVGNASVKGVEADGALKIIPGFTLAASLTYQDPRYASLVNDAGADPGAVNGNQIIREPKIFGNIRPSFDFNLGTTNVDLFGRYNYTGLRYVDLFNQTALPAYHTLGAGVTLTHESWQYQIVGDNITNEHGLTEGNPRTDQLSGQGSQNAIYGRPLFGRSFRFMVSKKW
jgi:iron complex outermembrane recepter protein